MWTNRVEEEEEEEVEEEEEEEEEDNTYPPGLDSHFCDMVQEMKRKVYEGTVLSPEMHTPAVHDERLLQVYVNKLTELFRILENAQRGRNSTLTAKERDAFKENEALLRELYEWVATFFRTNGPSNTIPYVDYLNNSLRVYPFVHRKEFDE